jgi:HEAT repeat protein
MEPAEARRIAALIDALARRLGEHEAVADAATPEAWADLAQRDAPAVEAALVSALDPARAARARQALHLLGDVGRPPVLQAVARAAASADLREDALAALARLAARTGAVPRLIEMLRDPEPAVRAAAAGALGRLKERAAAAALVESVEDASLWHRPSAVPPGAPASGDDERADVLGAFLDALAVLGSDERALRALVARAPLPRRQGVHLTRRPGEDALAILAGRLGSPAFPAVEAAVSEAVRQGGAPAARLIQALAATGDPRCRPWLLRCLGQPEWNLVALAVALLADHGRGEDTAALLDHMPEVDPAWKAAPHLARAVAGTLHAILGRDVAAVPQAVLWKLASLRDRPLRVTLPPVPLRVEQLDLAELRARASAELARRGRA